MLTYREQQVVDHLKEHRPKMYAELVKNGQLESQAKRMWQAYTDSLHDLTMHKGLPFDQAQELSRELAFPPAESDQPNLGEDPRRATSVETTS